MNADGRKLSVIAFTDDGEAREVLLDNAQRLAVKMLLQQMFPGRKIPVSSVSLPLEPIAKCAVCELVLGDEYKTCETCRRDVCQLCVSERDDEVVCVECRYS